MQSRCTDPEGSLFYNDLNEFDVDKSGHQHTYKVEQVQYKAKFYIVIEWFRDGSSTPYAKVLIHFYYILLQALTMSCPDSLQLQIVCVALFILYLLNCC